MQVAVFCIGASKLKLAIKGRIVAEGWRMAHRYPLLAMLQCEDA
jgi:hypothetical protein